MKLETLIIECTIYNLKLVLKKRRPNNWLKSVSAFANGLNGYLFFDMNDGIAEDVYNEGNKDVFYITKDKLDIIQTSFEYEN
jgi:predicted HTH transcriptional regulator